MEEIKEKNNEVAKYSNELNKVPLRGMKLNEKKVFMTLLWLVKETDGNEVSIDYSRFIELTQAKPRSLEDGVKLVKGTFRKILTLAIAEVDTGKADEEFLFFTSRRIDHDTKRITVKVNPDYAHFIKGFAKSFTSYPLEIGNSFKSEYTIDIYKYFRQYSDTGFWAVTIEDFRKLLSIPVSYNLGMMVERIIKPSLEELSTYYPELSFEKVFERKKKGQRGRRKVQSLRFHFTQEAHDEWVEGKYDEVEKSKSITNVPTWSQPDYVNTTTEQEKADMAKRKEELLASMDKIKKADAEPKL